MKKGEAASPRCGSNQSGKRPHSASALTHSELRVAIAAANLRVTLDRRLNRPTPAWVKDLASRDPSSEAPSSLSETTSWWQLIQDEFGMLADHHVAEFLGRPTERNLAPRLNEAGQILGVSWRGITQYPGFQFNQVTGAVHPVIAGIAKIGRKSSWEDSEILTWMCTPSDYLSGRPADNIEDGKRLLRAARAELKRPRS